MNDMTIDENKKIDDIFIAVRKASHYIIVSYDNETKTRNFYAKGHPYTLLGLVLMVKEKIFRLPSIQSEFDFLKVNNEKAKV